MGRWWGMSHKGAPQPTPPCDSYLINDPCIVLKNTSGNPFFGSTKINNTNISYQFIVLTRTAYPCLPYPPLPYPFLPRSIHPSIYRMKALGFHCFARTAYPLLPYPCLPHPLIILTNMYGCPPNELSSLFLPQTWQKIAQALYIRSKTAKKLAQSASLKASHSASHFCFIFLIVCDFFWNSTILPKESIRWSSSNLLMYVLSIGLVHICARRKPYYNSSARLFCSLFMIRVEIWEKKGPFCSDAIFPSQSGNWMLPPLPFNPDHHVIFSPDDWSGR